MQKKSRVIIVVNKYWECDPVCAVLTSAYLNDEALKLASPINLGPSTSVERVLNSSYPSFGPVKPPAASETVPRIMYITEERVIEVWCISDLLSNSSQKDQSSSEVKGTLLPIIFKYDTQNEIELVVAVGTASSGPGVTKDNSVFKSDNINGSVVIGSKVYMHNGIIGDSTSNYDPQDPQHYECSWSTVESSQESSVIDQLLVHTKFATYTQLLLATSTFPSSQEPNYYVDKMNIALGDVNVTDYTKYGDNDKATGEEFFKKTAKSEHQYGVSLETTHCLIYQAAKDHLKQDPPFIFVSGIVDRFTKFNDDVNPKIYAQNVVGGNNAGAAVAIIISKLLK